MKTVLSLLILWEIDAMIYSYILQVHMTIDNIALFKNHLYKIGPFITSHQYNTSGQNSIFYSVYKTQRTRE
jgi:hypothetical protein